MADGTSVGKITLEIDLSQDLQTQISETADKISTGLQSGLEKGFNIDNLLNSISQKFKKTIDNMNSMLNSLQAHAKAVVQDIGNIRVNQPTQNTATPVTAPRTQIRVSPKINITDINAIKAQIDALTASLEITNRLIEQQQAKLAILKERYAITFDEARKNKLEEQILKTEQRINKLIATSDAAGFKLADLDAQFRALSNGAYAAASGIENVNQKLNKTDNATAKNSRSTSAFNRTIQQLGLSSTMFGRMLDRMLIRMVVFNLVIRQIDNFTKFMGNAMMTNAAFANSLAQIKANLEVAFMPIYNTILPAIMALMQALARATTYIAAFINALFGTTYQASAEQAKALNANIAKYQQLEKATSKWGGAVEEAANKAKNSLAGFDEVNVLNQKETAPDIPALPTVDAPMPIVAPPIDVSPTAEGMQKIADAASKVREVFFALLPAIAAVATAFLALNIISTVINWIRGVVNAFALIGGAGPVVLAIVAIAALTAAFITLYKTNQTFRDGVNRVADAIGKFLQPVFQSLKTVMLDVWNNALVPFGKALIDIWNTAIVPLGKIIMDVLVIAFKAVWDILQSLWNYVLVPLGDFLVSIFTKTLQAVAEIWQAWKPTVQGIIDVIKWLWDNLLKPFVQFIADVFTNVFRESFKIIGNIIGDMKTIMGGLLDFIVGVFTGNWSKAWNGLKNIFKGVWDGIVNIAKGAVNAIVGAINAFIRMWNTLHFTVPEIDIPFVGKVGGFTVGLSPLNEIPYLARGGIIDQPTLAMVGESGKEAVVPLENTNFIDSMASAIGTAVLQALQFSKGNSNQSNSQGDIILTIDGTTFARITKPYADRENERIGNSVIIQTT